MKTSYLLLILALLILFGTTAAYDIALQKEYLKGDYKKPYGAYNQLNFRDFDSIEVVASHIIRTTIVQGDKFDVKLHKFAKDAHIEQKGSKLIVTFKTDMDAYYGNAASALFIQCPSLKSIKTDAVYILNGDTITARKHGSNRFNSSQVLIKGFKQDNLSVEIDNFSTVLFRDNQFKFLHADVGSQDSSRSTIDLDNSNQVLSAEIDLQQNSIMSLKDIFINNFKYKLSDSAQVSLSGISLRLLSNK